MKILAILMLLLMFSISVNAQRSVKGKVIDSDTGKPLHGANIKLLDSQRGAASDQNGFFTLDINTQDTIKIQISFVGFDTKTVSIYPGENEVDLIISMVAETTLEEVVIKAVRAEKDAPVTQTTIDKETIEKEHLGQDPVFTIREVTPNIIAHSESGSGFANYSFMRLRGIDQTRINITLNGIPLNDMIDHGVFFSNFTDFGNSIESVQVQRGVGASTNGTASYAGSINFESVSLDQEKPSAEVQLLAGSFDTYRASGEVSSGVMDNNLSFYSRFTKTLSNGYKFHSGTNSNSFFFSGGYLGDRDLFKITTFLGRTKNELAYLPVFIDDIDQEPKTNYLSPNDEDDFGQWFVQFHYTRDLLNNLSMSSSLYYGGAGGDFPFGFDDANGNFTQINFPLYNDHYGLMSSFHYTNDRLDMTGGIHLYTFKRINEESIIPDVTNPYYSDNSRKNEISAFGKGSYNFGDVSIYGDLQIRSVWLELQPDLDFLGSFGISSDTVNVPTRKWTFFNPKIGITYSVNPELDLYLSFGRTGREPTRFDILGSTSINSFNLDAVENKEAVKPEYVNDFEAGARIDLANFRTQANLFYMKFNNEIAPIGEFIPEGFVQLRKNIKNSYRTGVEWEWNWRILDAISFGGDASYMKSQIDEFSPENTSITFNDVEPILSPELILDGKITFHHQNIFDLSITGRYVSESFLELTNRDNLILPSYFVTNLQGNFKFLNKHLFTIQFNNIFNERYFTNGSPVDVDFDGIIDGPGYMIQPPRHFYAILKLRF